MHRFIFNQFWMVEFIEARGIFIDIDGERIKYNDKRKGRKVTEIHQSSSCFNEFLWTLQFFMRSKTYICIVVNRYVTAHF